MKHKNENATKQLAYGKEAFIHKRCQLNLDATSGRELEDVAGDGDTCQVILRRLHSHVTSRVPHRDAALGGEGEGEGGRGEREGGIEGVEGT